MISLSTFGRALRSSGGVARTEPIFLGSYLVLYDMLNDDDEELRYMAAGTASWVLSYSAVSTSKAISLAPLNASRLVAQFITENYAGSLLLCHKVLLYISGQVPRISDAFASWSTLIPVDKLLAGYREENMVLFVEEKQNLFVDEVREIDLWISVLPHLAEALHDDDHLLNEIHQWVAEGLVCLSATVTNDMEKDGLLGWTSKPEIFTLGIRLISLSSALLKGMLSAEDRSALKWKLEILLEGGSRALWNEEWLRRLRAAVEDSS